MVMRGATLVLTLTLSPVVGWTAGVWHGTTAPRRAVQLSSAPDAPASAVEVSPRLDALPPDDAQPLLEPVDSHEPSLGPAGDDATPAIATYGRDEAGELYEEHSPQTEVTRLREPVG